MCFSLLWDFVSVLCWQWWVVWGSWASGLPNTAKESQGNLPVPWTHCDLSRLHRGKDCRQPEHICVLFGFSGGYSGSHGPCVRRNPHFHGCLQGVWACRKHPRTLEQQPRLWEKALQTRTSVTAKTGDHQKAAGRSQKPASVAGLCGVLCAGRMGWPRAGPEELSTGKNMGEPGNLRSHTRRMLQGVTGLSHLK